MAAQPAKVLLFRGLLIYSLLPRSTKAFIQTKHSSRVIFGKLDGFIATTSPDDLHTAATTKAHGEVEAIMRKSVDQPSSARRALSGSYSRGVCSEKGLSHPWGNHSAKRSFQSIIPLM